jgi:hypothetical protein
VLLQYAGVYRLVPKTAVDRAAEGWLVLNVSSHDMPLDQDQDPSVPRRYGDAGHLDRRSPRCWSTSRRGADANGDLHGRKTGYPNWDFENPRVMETARYFDTVNFAARITAPAIVAVGFIDTITPPVGIWIACNRMRGPTEVIPMIESDHNNRTPEKQGAWERRWREVLAALVSGGTFVPVPTPTP